MGGGAAYYFSSSLVTRYEGAFLTFCIGFVFPRRRPVYVCAHVYFFLSSAPSPKRKTLTPLAYTGFSPPDAVWLFLPWRWFGLFPGCSVSLHTRYLFSLSLSPDDFSVPVSLSYLEHMRRHHQPPLPTLPYFCLHSIDFFVLFS